MFARKKILWLIDRQVSILFEEATNENISIHALILALRQHVVQIQELQRDALSLLSL